MTDDKTILTNIGRNTVGKTETDKPQGFTRDATDVPGHYRDGHDRRVQWNDYAIESDLLKYVCKIKSVIGVETDHFSLGTSHEGFYITPKENCASECGEIPLIHTDELVFAIEKIKQLMESAR